MNPRIIQRASLAAGVALLSLTLGACDLAFSGFREEARDTWRKTYPLSANGRVEIVNTNGHIKVLASDSPRVEVTAERVARSGTEQAAKELLQKIEIREDVTADRIKLESRSPTGFGLRGSTQVEYTLHVPASAIVDLRTTNGGIDVRDLKQETRLSTTNGQIEGKGLYGQVHASTTNGGIDLDLQEVSQEIDVSTTNGGVNVTIPKTANADIAARCTNGHIAVDNLPVQREGEGSRKQFNGKVNAGGPRIQVSTTNGGISIAGR